MADRGDADSELARAKWLLVSVLLFVVSCFICYGEVVSCCAGGRHGPRSPRRMKSPGAGGSA